MRVTQLRTLGELTLVLALCSCDAKPDGWTVLEQKSGRGVPHIVNEPPPTGIEPTWTIEPELRIGAVEGDGPDNFGSIKGIAVDDQDRIAVLDAQAQEIRIFAPDGKHLRTFGRKGAGPGELADANGLLIGNDGLLRVNDPSNSRLSFFHPDTGFAGSTPLNVQSFGWVWSAVLDTAGKIIERSWMVTGGEGREILKGYDARGHWVDTIPLPRPNPAQNQRGVYTWSRGTGRSMATVPYWPSAVSALDPRHAFWTKLGDRNEYVITRTAFTGDTTLIFESRRPAVAVTQAERDSTIAALRKSSGGELDWSQIPDTKPIVTQVFTADQGDVWIRVTSSDPRTTYDVFGNDGRYKGTAVLSLRPIRFQQPIVLGDRFYAVVTDDLDVQYVMRGRLVRIN
jgi:hypothetical protein